MRYVAQASRLLGPNANLIVGSAVTPSPNSSGSGPAVQSGVTPSPVPITSLFQSWEGSFLAAPILWVGVLVAFVIVWKLIEEHRGGKENFAKIRVDATNMVKLFVMVLVSFIIARFLFTKYSIPGVSSTVLYGIGQG